MGFIKNLGIIDKETDQGIILFNTDSGSMVELNKTAALLWQKTGQTFTHQDLKLIIETNCTGFGEIVQDIESFVHDAQKLALITKNEEN